MKTGTKKPPPQSGEAEFREIFTGLDETGQDRILDTARALDFAAKSRRVERRPGENGDIHSATSGGTEDGGTSQ
jgi:hypothetical protein